MPRPVPDEVILWALEQHLMNNGGAFPESGGVFEIDALVQVKGRVVLNIRRGVCNAEIPELAMPSKSISTRVDLEVTVVQDMRPNQPATPESCP